MKKSVIKLIFAFFVIYSVCVCCKNNREVYTDTDDYSANDVYSSSDDIDILNKALVNGVEWVGYENLQLSEDVDSYTCYKFYGRNKFEQIVELDINEAGVSVAKISGKWFVKESEEGPCLELEYDLDDLEVRDLQYNMFSFENYFASENKRLEEFRSLDAVYGYNNLKLDAEGDITQNGQKIMILDNEDNLFDMSMDELVNYLFE